MKNSSGNLQSENQNSAETGGDNGASGETRRKALAKLGLYAAYTAPIMLGMMASTRAQAASGRPGTNCDVANCDLT